MQKDHTFINLQKGDTVYTVNYHPYCIDTPMVALQYTFQGWHYKDNGIECHLCCTDDHDGIVFFNVPRAGRDKTGITSTCRPRVFSSISAEHAKQLAAQKLIDNYHKDLDACHKELVLLNKKKNRIYKFINNLVNGTKIN